MKKFLYISNGTKSEDYYSKENITLNNMRKCCIGPASKMGYEVYMSQNRKYVDEIKVNDYDVKMYDANIYRNIFNFKDNIRAYKQLNKFLDSHSIDVIHCNTPIGGVLGRICGSKHHVKKIIYTAHGFHFYKGNSPIKNFVFKTIEKHLAKKTDVIITINKEDYEAAKEFKLKEGGKVFLTHGVGINLDEYKNTKVDIHKKREELGLSDDDIIVISTGDLIKRKNYSLALDVIAGCNNPRIKYAICGKGPELNKLKKRAEKLNITEQVFFLGYRNDIKILLKISNIFLSTSKQEGLPRSLMEAMATGLPCVVSNIRGNTDLISDRKNGFCCNAKKEYICAINEIVGNRQKTKIITANSLKTIKRYDFDSISKEMLDIYKNTLPKTKECA